MVVLPWAKNKTYGALYVCRMNIAQMKQDLFMTVCEQHSVVYICWIFNNRADQLVWIQILLGADGRRLEDKCARYDSSDN